MGGANFRPRFSTRDCLQNGTSLQGLKNPIVNIQNAATTNKPGAPKSGRWMTRGILGIGLANLFSDWGHEAATSLLPALLALIGAPAVALGVIEGVADGLSSFAKLAGGWIADRAPLRRPTGVIGYLATGVSTCAYAFAHTWPTVLLLRALGW